MVVLEAVALLHLQAVAEVDIPVEQVEMAMSPTLVVEEGDPL
jgi:hypothetical protein